MSDLVHEVHIKRKTDGRYLARFISPWEEITSVKSIEEIIKTVNDFDHAYPENIKNIEIEFIDGRRRSLQVVIVKVEDDN